MLRLLKIKEKYSDLCALLGIVEASVCDGGVATYGPGYGIKTIFVCLIFLIVQRNAKVKTRFNEMQVALDRGKQ